MDRSAVTPPQVASSGPELDNDDARVARAAAELGVPVPRGFRLAGMGQDGRHRAAISGTAQDFRHGTAILARLDGKTISEALAAMDTPAGDGRTPEWAPPADWTDTDAMLAWLAERDRHPEWPQFYNGVGEWAAIVTAFLGGQIGVKAIAEAIASTRIETKRLAFYRYAVDQAVAQGREVDAVALIRAVQGAPAAGSAETPGPGSGEPSEAE